MGGLGRIGSGIALLVALSALQVPLYRHYGIPYEDPRGRQVPLANISLTNSDGAVSRLSQLLKLRTVSNAKAENNVEQPEQFSLAHEHLEASYPEAWKHMTVETVAQHSLLLRWGGQNAALQPVLFVGHLDVVPATEGSHSDWSKEPFSGELADNHIWGRGAMDLKFMLVALLEAATELIKLGWSPERTIYLGFGHDEEVGGDLGAGAMAALLKSRGVTLDMVLDEGGPIITDGLPSLLGTDTQIALVGTAEKGYTSVMANVSGPGGHAMTPPSHPQQSVITKLAQLADAVNRNPPHPQLVPPVTDFMKALAPACPSAVRRAILHQCDNFRGLSGLLARVLTFSGPNTAAVARTTVAMTRMNAGSADNVVPDTGSLLFNFRLLPGHEIQYAKDYLHMCIASLTPRFWQGKSATEVTVKLHDAAGQKARTATPVSSPHSEQFKLVAQAIYETVQPPQGIVVAPHLMTGASDSRHYLDIMANGVYRFFPLFLNLTAGELNRVHGVDERIKVDDFLHAIKVYMRIMQLTCGKRP